MEKNLVIWDFFLSRSIRWFKFRFILHVIFLEELQKIKSSGFAAAMWAHSY
jgi:hypothetical protein